MTEEQHKKIAEMMNHSYDESLDYLIHKENHNYYIQFL